MSTEREISNYLVHLLKCSFNSTVPSAPKSDFDWLKFLKFAKMHLVDDTVFNAVEKIKDIIPEEIFMAWTKIRFTSLLMEETLDKDRCDLTNCLEENQIKFLPLKGVVIKDLYPKGVHRQMADNDILIKRTDLDKCIKVLNEIGFKNTPVDDHYYDISFKRNDLAHFEMHFWFVKPSDDYFFYFNKMIDKSIVDDNKHYSSHLSDEDFYISIVYHFHKHFKTTGCGVRFLADDYLFMKSKKDSLDWNYLNKQFKILGLTSFQKEMSRLSFKVFEDKELTDRETKLFKAVMISGVFGYSKNDNAKVISFDDEQYSAKKHFIKKLFPSFLYMKEAFPILQKVPILLPFYYIKRIIYKRKNQNVSIFEYIDNISVNKKQ